MTIMTAIGRYAGITVGVWMGTASVLTIALVLLLRMTPDTVQLASSLVVFLSLRLLGVPWRRLLPSLVVASVLGILGMEASIVPWTSASLTVLVTVPVAEEGLFRGYCYKGLRGYTGVLTAAAVSSFLFAFVHFTPDRFLRQVVLGAVLAFLYELTDSLPVTTAAHVVHNLIVLGAL